MSHSNLLHMNVPSLFVLLVLCSLNIAAQYNTSIVLDVVDEEKNSLNYFDDYQIELFANGLKMSNNNYFIDQNSITYKYVATITHQQKLKTLNIRFYGEKYNTTSINLTQQQLSKNYIDLSAIVMHSLPLSISDVVIYDKEEDNEVLVFEFTFKNTSLKDYKINNILARASIKSNCASDSDVFADIRVDNKVYISTAGGDNNLMGKFHNSDRGSALMRGNINYNECGNQSMHLEINAVTTIPSDNYSKLLISIPNNLTFYEVNQNGVFNENVVSINRTDKYAEDKSFRTIFELIPDVEFIFNLDSSEQPEIKVNKSNFN